MGKNSIRKWKKITWKDTTKLIKSNKKEIKKYKKRRVNEKKNSFIHNSAHIYCICISYLLSTELKLLFFLLLFVICSLIVVLCWWIVHLSYIYFVFYGYLDISFRAELGLCSWCCWFFFHFYCAVYEYCYEGIKQKA